jgi:hypothetical protein
MWGRGDGTEASGQRAGNSFNWEAAGLAGMTLAVPKVASTFFMLVVAD